MTTYHQQWDELYGAGQHLNRAPYDVVVSFVFRNRPREKERAQTRICELGCGAGNNLFFLAGEGFDVAGVDGSADAIRYARERIEGAGLTADLSVGDFTARCFDDESADLIVDRGALTCCGYDDVERALRHARQAMRRGARMLFNPYSAEHTSAHSGKSGPGGVRLDIDGGSLAGLAQVRFFDEREVRALATSAELALVSLSHLAIEEREGERSVHAEWRAVLERR